DCENIFRTFQQAYVGKDHCEVPPEAYDPLFALAPIDTPVDTAMFWSKTKTVVHNYVNKNKGCFVTMEDTLLGSVLDDVDWCGQVGSSETFEGCPEWNYCVNNPKRSFWTRGSAKFAEAAKGVATVMLNGALDAPFDASSIFGKTELPRLNSTTVSKLTVVLVMPKHPKSDCSDVFFKELLNRLDSKIGFECNSHMRRERFPEEE
uniref:ADP-ribosyl cyclase/cyclic ADP-ribose hydrolase n=1 Tax=Tetraodon nigroviridis TaxID=99883 RepID=H3D816_TETNG